MKKDSRNQEGLVFGQISTDFLFSHFLKEPVHSLPTAKSMWSTSTNLWIMNVYVGQCNQLVANVRWALMNNLVVFQMKSLRVSLEKSLSFLLKKFEYMEPTSTFLEVMFATNLSFWKQDPHEFDSREWVN